MKLLLSLFTTVLLVVSSSSFAQEKTVFQSAGLTQSGDGAPCVQLNWKKGAENTAYYLVERSSNGVDFKQVALVFTAEEASFSDYKFRDKGYSSSGNAVYYRISIVSDQKELTYLPAKKVDLTSAVSSYIPIIPGEGLARLK